MAQLNNWTRISSYLKPVETGRPLTGVSVMLEELAQIIGDAAFVERADLAAHKRVSQLEGMLTACEQELDQQEGAVAQELDGAIADLREELAYHRSLNALDAAFREDQRDAICLRLERFRQGVQEALYAPSRAGGLLGREGVEALLRIIETCDAEQVFRVARMQARDGEEGPKAQHLLTRAGWQVWMAERAGGALRQSC